MEYGSVCMRRKLMPLPLHGGNGGGTAGGGGGEGSRLCSSLHAAMQLPALKLMVI